MIISESEIIPYSPADPPGKRVLVLASHPDDETLGCGGTIRLYAESKKNIKVVFLTSGDKADPANHLSHIVHKKAHITDYSLMREKEAEKALRILGVFDYEFLRFPDRELYENYRHAFDRLAEIAEDFAPDAICSPSMIELNPDHRTTAALALELQEKLVQGPSGGKDPDRVSVLFFEVTAPLRPNLLVDVTSVYKRKIKAVKAYKSQLKLTDYLGHITALNTVRKLTVSSSKYVEAFWYLGSVPTGRDIENWLSYRYRLHDRIYTR